jgi:hypothetical protein
LANRILKNIYPGILFYNSFSVIGGGNNEELGVRNFSEEEFGPSPCLRQGDADNHAVTIMRLIREFFY